MSTTPATTKKKAAPKKKTAIKKAAVKKKSVKKAPARKSVKKKPKKKTLTEKEEKACQEYILCGGNQSEAYRRAYDCENSKPETVWTNAYKLFAKAHVMQRVLELQEAHRERHNVTVDSITQELDEAREMAIETEQSSAMTAASMGKAKLHGLIVDKTKDVGTRKKKRKWKILVVDPINKKAG